MRPRPSGPVLRLAGIVPESIVDGPGLRLAVFAQGCARHCPGCHNPATHDYAGGILAGVPEVLAMLEGNPLLEGLSLSGGEPFDQPEGFAALARGARQRGCHVMAWSGYTFEELAGDARRRELLEAVDVLVDGPFVLALRSLALPWRGSSNQRVLDAPLSLAEGRAAAADCDKL